MKKTIALLLAVIMCFSLFACSGNDEENRNNDPQNNHGENVENNEKSEYKREITDEGYVVISTAEFASYITKIELTIENWQEYLEIVELTEQERNGFGEIINSYTSTEFTAKNAIGCYFDDVAINFADIQTGAKIYCEGQFHRIIIPDNYSYSWEGYTVNDFVCEKIIGSLILLNHIPEDCISVYEDGGKFVCVGSKDDYRIIDMNNTKDMSMDVSLAFWMQ